MKNKIVLTISDYEKTKSYSLSKLAVKAIFFALFILFFIALGSIFYVFYLQDEIDSLTQDKQKYINSLALQDEKLFDLGKNYSDYMEKKSEDTELLLAKLEELKSINDYENSTLKDEINQNILASFRVDKRNYSLQNIPSGTPLKDFKISSAFGFRKDPINYSTQFHKGLDFTTSNDKNIYATANGIVEFTQSNDVGQYGKSIKIAHSFGFKTAYAHLSEILVNEGDFIKKGDVIGIIGNSGRSTGRHLHYEVSYLNKNLDPINFVKWDINSYDKIFRNERRVGWEKLIVYMNQQIN